MVGKIGVSDAICVWSFLSYSMCVCLGARIFMLQYSTADPNVQNIHFTDVPYYLYLSPQKMVYKYLHMNIKQKSQMLPHTLLGGSFIHVRFPIMLETLDRECVLLSISGFLFSSELASRAVNNLLILKGPTFLFCDVYYSFFVVLSYAF